MRTPSLIRSLLAAGLLCAGFGLGCRSHPYGEIDRANAKSHLDAAERDIQAGDDQRALEHLAEVREVSGLDPDLRAREETLIDAAASGRFEQLAGASPAELEDLFDTQLPDRVRARAGILAADRMLAEESRISAFRMVKKVDEALPSHPERVLAGDVLARAGLALIRDDRRYKLLFRYRPRGIQTLEYLVLNYPLEPRCPEAYSALSEAYEKEGDLDQAIERSQDLLLYHPETSYAVVAAARLPYLRLCRLGRDDYDRSELARADAELALWLERHPQHELAEWVHSLVKECRTRLVRSDLSLALFYEKVESPAGVRWHAGRAQKLALEAGLTNEAEEARALLAECPPSAPAAAGTSTGETPGVQP